MKEILGLFSSIAQSNMSLHVGAFGHRAQRLGCRGSIEEAKVDSFNFPVYCPSPAEIKYAVEKEGSFTINLLKTLQHQMDTCEGYNEAQSVRAFAQPLLVRHFGDADKLMDDVFNKCRDIYDNIMAKEKNIFTNVTVSLIKRND